MTELTNINIMSQTTYDTLETKNDNELYFTDADSYVDNRITNIMNNKITNCITDIPQDIKLELKDGTLTLKAGSKVYVPNGFEADGTTPKFDVINITSDISTNYAGYPDYDEIFICLKTDGSFATCFKSGKYQNSGSSGTAYSFTYRTDLNKIYDYEESATNPYEQVSFPIGKFKYQNNGIAVVYQVFNGFGYIGSTVFALPGVKGLIPNGRNEDGSLKNIEFTTSSVLTFTNTYANVQNAHWLMTSSSLTINGAYSYNEFQNLNYNQITVDSACDFVISQTDSSGKIIGWNPKTAFHVLDYNDKSTISGWFMPSNRYIDLTLGASGATYTAPANGIFSLAKKSVSTGSNTLAVIINVNKEYGNYLTLPINAAEGYVSLSVKKGDTVKVSYNGSFDIFRFIYAEGEN